MRTLLSPGVQTFDLRFNSVQLRLQHLHESLPPCKNTFQHSQVRAKKIDIFIETLDHTICAAQVLLGSSHALGKLKGLDFNSLQTLNFFFDRSTAFAFLSDDSLGEFLFLGQEHLQIVDGFFLFDVSQIRKKFPCTFNSESISFVCESMMIRSAVFLRVTKRPASSFT